MIAFFAWSVSSLDGSTIQARDLRCGRPTQLLLCASAATACSAKVQRAALEDQRRAEEARRLWQQELQELHDSVRGAARRGLVPEHFRAFHAF